MRFGGAILLAFTFGIYGAWAQDAVAPSLQYQSPADISRVKAIVLQMLDDGDSQENIDAYIKANGYTAAELKASSLSALSPVGRWQVIALPPASSATETSAILLDTMTGQTWDYTCVLSPMPGYPLACRNQWTRIPVMQATRPSASQ